MRNSVLAILFFILAGVPLEASSLTGHVTAHCGFGTPLPDGHTGPSLEPCERVCISDWTDGTCMDPPDAGSRVDVYGCAGLTSASGYSCDGGTNGGVLLASYSTGETIAFSSLSSDMRWCTFQLDVLRPTDSDPIGLRDFLVWERDDCGGSPPVGPRLELSPTSHDFGHIARYRVSDPQTFTVRNAGDAPLEVYRTIFRPEDHPNFFLTFDNCSSVTLPPGTECTVGVSFYPSGSALQRTSTLVVESNGGTGEASLVGAGLYQPPIANAGPDIMISCECPNGTDILLNGTGSTDSDDLSFAWSAPGIDFPNPQFSRIQAHFPVGTTDVTLVVMDEIGATSTDTVRVTVGLLEGPCGVAEPAPLVNPSFEEPIVTGPWARLNMLPGWNDGNIDLHTNLLAADGRQVADLNQNGPGFISQDFDTVPGARYLVDFAHGVNHECTQSARFSVEMNRAALGVFDSAVALERHQVQFMTGTSRSQLRFNSLSFGCGAATIDDVRLSRCTGVTLPVNDAEVRSHQSSVPPSVRDGQGQGVVVRVYNRGTTTWTAGSLYRLGARDEGSPNEVAWDGFICGGYMNSPTDARAFLCHDVPPGSFHDFSFRITVQSGAPFSPRLAVRMVQGDVEWFGDSHEWSIEVTPEPADPCPPPSPPGPTQCLGINTGIQDPPPSWVSSTDNALTYTYAIATLNPPRDTSQCFAPEGGCALTGQGRTIYSLSYDLEPNWDATQGCVLKVIAPGIDVVKLSPFPIAEDYEHADSIDENVCAHVRAATRPLYDLARRPALEAGRSIFAPTSSLALLTPHFLRLRCIDRYSQDHAFELASQLVLNAISAATSTGVKVVLPEIFVALGRDVANRDRAIAFNDEVRRRGAITTAGPNDRLGDPRIDVLVDAREMSHANAMTAAAVALYDQLYPCATSSCVRGFSDAARAPGVIRPTNVDAEGRQKVGLSITTLLDQRTHDPSSISTCRSTRFSCSRIPGELHGTDTYISSVRSQQAFGTETHLNIGFGGGGRDTLVALARFNLANPPAGTRLVSGSLVLAGEGGRADELPWARLEQITTPWSEDTVTWNSRPCSWEGSNPCSVQFPGGVAFPLAAHGMAANVVPLLKKWWEGEPNFGLAIRPLPSPVSGGRPESVSYFSTEARGLRPQDPPPKGVRPSLAMCFESDPVRETLLVPVTSPGPTLSTSRLRVGHRYRVTVSGTIIWGGCDPISCPDAVLCGSQRLGDGAWVTDDCWDSQSDASYGLWINDQKVDWSAYRPDHVYSKEIDGYDGVLAFRYNDCSFCYPDNHGFLVVNIEEAP